MQNPANFRVFGLAEELAVDVYRLTRRFPSEERFGLTSQLRRSAVSVGANIAEGCGRSSDPELIQFLHHSMGSASELEFLLRVAIRVGVVDRASIADVVPKVIDTKKMLSRLITVLRRRGRSNERRTERPKNRMTE